MCLASFFLQFKMKHYCLFNIEKSAYKCQKEEKMLK